MHSKKCVILNRTLLLQFKTRLLSAGLCVSSTAVCIFTGVCALFPLIKGSYISPMLCTVVMWVNVDQDLFCHMGSLENKQWFFFFIGLNQNMWTWYWISGLWVTLHTARPETGECTPLSWFCALPSPHFEKHASSFIDYTKWVKVTRLARIWLLKPVRGQKGDHRPLESQIYDAKYRRDAETNCHFAVSEHGCVYSHCRDVCKVVWLCRRPPMSSLELVLTTFYLILGWTLIARIQKSLYIIIIHTPPL